MSDDGREQTAKARALKYAADFGDDWDRECGFQDGFNAGAEWQRTKKGGRAEEAAFEAGVEAGMQRQREQTPRYEVLAEQAERITELEAALTECRGALSELRQNARCSTDPAFVRAFDAATAVLAHTNAEALEARP